MRSEVIFRASEAIDNKYELCQTVSKATRRLHVGTQEMNQTINNAFVRIAASADLPLRFQGAQRPTVLSLTVGNLRISNRLRFDKN
jgi:hypothetical protein